jgi:gliding motility-associated-like protein
LNYIFSWYDGQATKPAADYISPVYQNVDVGPYTVTATDETTGCVSNPTTVTVLDKTVIPVFDLSSTPSYCFGSGPDNNKRTVGTGSVTLTLKITDMVLSDVQWTDVATNTPVGLGPQVFELFPGVYSVQAISTLGCKADGIVTVDTEVSPYNGVSANNDSHNDNFIIDCITSFPNNNVKIYNRNGILIYEVDGYDNDLVSFRGIGLDGLYLASRELPVGTYFYIIDKRNGTKPKTGFLELIR